MTGLGMLFTVAASLENTVEAVAPGVADAVSLPTSSTSGPPRWLARGCDHGRQ